MKTYQAPHLKMSLKRFTMATYNVHCLKERFLITQYKATQIFKVVLFLQLPMHDITAGRFSSFQRHGIFILVNQSFASATIPSTDSCDETGFVCVSVLSLSAFLHPPPPLLPPVSVSLPACVSTCLSLPPVPQLVSSSFVH